MTKKELLGLVIELSLVAIKLEAMITKVKGDTDGALLMLEGRIHAVESVNAVAHELLPATSAKTSAKS